MVMMLLLQYIADVRMDYRMSVILTLFKNQVTVREEGDNYDDKSPEYIPPLNTSVLKQFIQFIV